MPETISLPEDNLPGLYLKHMQSLSGMTKGALMQARRLSLEWQAYIGRTHALRKVFASVKGFYFQAEVLGQMVTWLVPHQLAQVSPSCLPISCDALGSL